MRCVAYIRVSTREQDELVQRKSIEEFARARGVTILNWYVDKGESGAKGFSERPASSQLLADLDTVKPECVLVWALDRIGRGMLDTIKTVVELEGRGVKVVSIKEEWLQTLDTNIRQLILSILSWVAQYERQRIRERQLAAWQAGKQKGRPPKITAREVEYYLKKYPGLSLKAILAIINQERREKGKPEISYRTLLAKVKELGYKRKLVK